MKRFTETHTSRPLRRRSSFTALLLLLGTALLGACAGQARDVDSEDYIEGVAITSRFGDLAAGAREVALERLEVQLGYLMEEISELSEDQMRGGGFPIPSPLFPRLEAQRRNLLEELFRERLLTFELLKLEVETELRLGS